MSRSNGRAAIFLAAALGASACGTGDGPGNEDDVVDEGMADIYGGPPANEDEPEPAPEPEDEPEPEAVAVPAYGGAAPPPEPSEE